MSCRCVPGYVWPPLTKPDATAHHVLETCEMRDNLIYDVGMHKGEDAAFYLKKGFEVVGIEANPQLCEECAQKFSAEVASGRLQIVNKAISHSVGTIDFFLNEQKSVWGTASPEWVRRNELRGTRSHPVKVESTTIHDVLLQFGVPYYMKVDIEGSDFLCLEGLLTVKERPKYVSVESSATSIEDTFAQLDLLDRLGYRRFKIVPQHNIAEQRCPDPAREGIFVDHRFENGSSGLFGEETPGEWRSLESVKWDYRRIHLDSRMVGPNHGIFRNFPSSKIRRLLETLFWRGRGWYDTHATF
jgi:FkbM family methyltransferase